jgi:hypothetical protein
MMVCRSVFLEFWQKFYFQICFSFSLKTVILVFQYLSPCKTLFIHSYYSNCRSFSDLASKILWHDWKVLHAYFVQKLLFEFQHFNNLPINFAFIHQIFLAYLQPLWMQIKFTQFICLCAWNNLRNAGWIFIKLHIGEFFKRLSHHFNLHIDWTVSMITVQADSRNMCA